MRSVAGEPPDRHFSIPAGRRKEYGLTDVDFLKADAEGAPADVIRTTDFVHRAGALATPMCA
jgi:hypothetical protein